MSAKCDIIQLSGRKDGLLRYVINILKKRGFDYAAQEIWETAATILPNSCLPVFSPYIPPSIFLQLIINSHKTQICLRAHKNRPR
jgi:hypothetical protein